MGWRDIESDPDMMAAIRRTGFPQYNPGGEGPRPGIYDWLDQIGHALSMAIVGRGGIGSPIRGVPKDLPPAGSAALPAPPLETILPGLSETSATQPGWSGVKVPFETAKRATSTAEGTKLQPTLDLGERMKEIGPVTPKAPRKWTGEQLNEVVGRIKAGDPGAKDDLVEMLKGVIGRVSRRFEPKLQSGALGVEDLQQEGQILAQEMAGGTAYTHGKPFLPYFTRGLRTKFQELVDQSGNMRMPQKEARMIRRLDQQNQLFYKLRGRFMNDAELQEATGIPAEQIREIYKGQAAEQSLQIPRPIERD